MTGSSSDLIAPSPCAIPTKALTTLLVTDRRSCFNSGVREMRPSRVPHFSSKPSKYSSEIKSLLVFKQLVDVIGKANDAGVVHRELKPGTVLILPDRSVKVIDFGICQIEGRTAITLVDEGVGAITIWPRSVNLEQRVKLPLGRTFTRRGKFLRSAITNQFAFSRESPVFNDKSMPNLSEDEQAYHLHHIFQKSIRQDPANRFNSTNRLSAVLIYNFQRADCGVAIRIRT
jgi:hypothetical protein